MWYTWSFILKTTIFLSGFFKHLICTPVLTVRLFEATFRENAIRLNVYMSRPRPKSDPISFGLLLKRICGIFREKNKVCRLGPAT